MNITPSKILKTTTLDQIIDLIGGGTPKTTVAEYWDGDIPWLSVADFNNDSRWVYEADKKITKLGLDNSSTKLLREGDIIISARGTVGALSQLAKPMALNQSCYGIRAKEGIDQNYLFYLVKRSIPQILKSVHGAVFDTITRDSFENVEITIPESLSEQKSIADMLGVLDDKIELLRRENKTLEAIAQTLFNRWFVDFEFPDAEGKPYRSAGGKMVESELGEIPERCGVGSLSDLFKITMGQSPDGQSYNEEGDGIVFYQGRTEFGERFPAVRLYTTEPKRFAESLDVLVSVRAPVGDINQAAEKCCLGRGVAGISSELKSFCFYTMTGIQSEIKKFEDGGTVFGSINKSDFENINLVTAPKSIQIKFDETVRGLDKKIFNNFLEIQTLSKFRDGLLNNIFNYI